MKREKEARAFEFRPTVQACCRGKLDGLVARSTSAGGEDAADRLEKEAGREERGRANFCQRRVLSASVSKAPPAIS